MAAAVKVAAAELAQGDASSQALADAVYLERVGDRLEDCGVTTAHVDRGCGVALAVPHSCHVRICPDCERARSARMVGKVVETAVDALRPVMWTLTLRNVPAGGLRWGHGVVADAFRRIRRAPVLAGARGGIYSLETTWNGPDRTWHPHLHVLLDSPWITWGDMRDAWRAATCDATRTARRRARGLPGRVHRCPHATDPDGRPVGGCQGSWMVWVSQLRGQVGTPEWVDGVREVVKYVSKGLLGKDGRLDPTIQALDLAELLLAIRHRRLVNGWGTFRRVTDELEDLEDGTRYGSDDFPWERGLPIVCPWCGHLADWSAVTFTVPRVKCRPHRGVLLWRPPPLDQGGYLS